VVADEVAPGVPVEHCPDCGGRIFYAYDAKGKRHAIDSAATPEGRCVTKLNRGRPRVEGYNPEKHGVCIRREAHMSTCPFGARKGKP
jgi:hypothetical protein